MLKSHCIVVRFKFGYLVFKSDAFSLKVTESLVWTDRHGLISNTGSVSAVVIGLMLQLYALWNIKDFCLILKVQCGCPSGEAVSCCYGELLLINAHACESAEFAVLYRVRTKCRCTKKPTQNALFLSNRCIFPQRLCFFNDEFEEKNLAGNEKPPSLLKRTGFSTNRKWNGL